MLDFGVEVEDEENEEEMEEVENEEEDEEEDEEEGKEDEKDGKKKKKNKKKRNPEKKKKKPAKEEPATMFRTAMTWGMIIFATLFVVMFSIAAILDGEKEFNSAKNVLYVAACFLLVAMFCFLGNQRIQKPDEIVFSCFTGSNVVLILSFFLTIGYFSFFLYQISLYDDAIGSVIPTERHTELSRSEAGNQHFGANVFLGWEHVWEAAADSTHPGFKSGDTIIDLPFMYRNCYKNDDPAQKNTDPRIFCDPPADGSFFNKTDFQSIADTGENIDHRYVEYRFGVDFNFNSDINCGSYKNKGGNTVHKCDTLGVYFAPNTQLLEKLKLGFDRMEIRFAVGDTNKNIHQETKSKEDMKMNDKTAPTYQCPSERRLLKNFDINHVVEEMENIADEIPTIRRRYLNGPVVPRQGTVAGGRANKQQQYVSGTGATIASMTIGDNVVTRVFDPFATEDYLVLSASSRSRKFTLEGRWKKHVDVTGNSELTLYFVLKSDVNKGTSVEIKDCKQKKGTYSDSMELQLEFPMNKNLKFDMIETTESMVYTMNNLWTSLLATSSLVLGLFAIFFSNALPTRRMKFGANLASKGGSKVLGKLGSVFE